MEHTDNEGERDMRNDEITIMDPASEIQTLRADEWRALLADLRPNGTFAERIRAALASHDRPSTPAEDEMDRAHSEGSARSNRAREAKAALTALRVDFAGCTGGTHGEALRHIDALLATCEDVQRSFVGAWN